ncbi:actin-binding protein IPP-like protein [Dinothrombium tinctorium]|uniref:Kelch-like protein diablo n=1 Tax=Dinothrombium tinctorium TaxID=1965070 RepID=A0A3S3SJ27_9ACAR|nr:actin-binding protein IPP-like protein [Dinothrombium tinctorium]
MFILIQEYWSNVGSNFDAYRRKGRFCDVEIKVGLEVFKGHKVILSASSPYFEAMLTYGLKEEQTSFIEIHDIQPKIFETILEFLYKGEINIREDNVQELLAAANMLQLQQIVNYCCNFLSKQLDPSNCVGIFLFAELHVCTNLKLEAKRYIERHFTDVIREDEFVDLPRDTLKNFLKSEGLSINDEFEVFEATIRWILKDIWNRKAFLSELMDYIRLPVIDPKQINLYIDQCPDIELKSCLFQLFNDFKEESKKLADNSVSDVSSKRCDLNCATYQNIRCQPRMCCRKKVYVIGGVNKARNRNELRTLVTVEKLDTFKKQWKSLPPMKIARSCHGTAVLNNMIYVAGGERDSIINDSVEVFDLIDEKWQSAKNMLKPRTCFGMCALDNYIYALGGWIGNDADSSIERYDARRDIWEDCGSMKLQQFGMGVVAHKGLIYVIGGFDRFSCAQNSVHSYNPVTKRWQQLRSMFDRRAFFGISILHDFIYVAGGAIDGNALNTVERYSIFEDTWTRISHMKQHRFSPCLVTANNSLLVIGGRSSNDNLQQPLNSVEIYDPEENVWRESLSMPTKRYEATAAVL